MVPVQKEGEVKRRSFLQLFGIFAAPIVAPLAPAFPKGLIVESLETSYVPPMIIFKGAIPADISIIAGGITWVDSEYDEMLGEVLRPLRRGE